MAKIDDDIEKICAGFQDPIWTTGTTYVTDEQMGQLNIRKKKAQDQHKLVYFSVGEKGDSPATFWGHRFSDAFKKALEWRGLPTKSARGRRRQAE